MECTGQPWCAIVSANPLALREENCEEANGFTPRRSARTVAEGVRKTHFDVFEKSNREPLPGGIRLTRSLRAAGGRVNVSGGAVIALGASRSLT